MGTPQGKKDEIEAQPAGAKAPEQQVRPERTEAVELTAEERAKRMKERDKLVEQYMPFAMYIVRKVSKTVAGSVDFEDLLSYAKVGLIEAAERFDSRFKVDFRTFAFYRIRGAIYDGLRTTGWLSRTQFAKHQFEEASNNYLRTMSDRTAAGGGKTFESPVGEIEDCIFNLASVYILSLDASEGVQLKDTEAQSVDSKCELEQTRDRVRDAIERLPQKERQLIKLYYYGGMTLDEAGTSLGLSRSWTSRLHARALELLQKSIRDCADEGELDGLTRKDSKKESGKEAAAVKPAKPAPIKAAAAGDRKSTEGPPVAAVAASRC